MPKISMIAASNPRRPMRGSRWCAPALAAVLISGSGFFATAGATFLDDFEGHGEVSQIPAAALRNWDIITSVDLQTEGYDPPLCHASGSCIDLVGTAGASSGGIVTKQSHRLRDYIIGFYLYGSGRDQTGAATSSGGTVSRLQVSLGGRSIYANNNIASDFVKFIVLRVRGSGKLKFLGRSEAPNIGPNVDNIFIVPANP